MEGGSCSRDKTFARYAGIVEQFGFTRQQIYQVFAKIPKAVNVTVEDIVDMVHESEAKNVESPTKDIVCDNNMQRDSKAHQDEKSKAGQSLEERRGACNEIEEYGSLAEAGREPEMADQEKKGSDPVQHYGFQGARPKSNAFFARESNQCSSSMKWNRNQPYPSNSEQSVSSHSSFENRLPSANDQRNAHLDMSLTMENGTPSSMEWNANTPFRSNLNKNTPSGNSGNLTPGSDQGPSMEYDENQLDRLNSLQQQSSLPLEGARPVSQENKRGTLDTMSTSSVDDIKKIRKEQFKSDTRDEPLVLEPMEQEDDTLPNVHEVDPCSSLKLAGGTLHRSSVKPKAEGESKEEREKITKLKQERQKLLANKICNACHVADINLLFLTCRHMVACEACGEQMDTCLKCGAQIIATVKIFKL